MSEQRSEDTGFMWGRRHWRTNEIAAQMRRAVDAETLPPEAEILMLLTNGASEIERLEAEVKHLRVIKP